MAGNDLCKLTIAELAPQIKARKVSPVEVTEAALAQAERLQPSLNSFITLLPDQARAQAAVREKAISRGEYLGPLDGIPIGLKDEFATAGIRTTDGSKVLTDYVPDFDAAVVEKCKQAGAIILGKENLHEFALGGTSQNPHYGGVHNPWNLDHIPGGSSGGAGANVAACVTFASLGTDLALSVRGPAAFCGVVGMKPTYGRVSLRGAIGTTFHGDHVGPLTRSVADNALVLQVIAGHDPLDPTTVPVPVPDYSAELGQDLSGLKVGIPTNYFFDPTDSEVEAKVRQGIVALQELGMEAVEVEFDTLQYAEALWIPSGVDLFIAHEPFLADHWHEYSPEFLRRVLAGQFILARDYSKATKLQRLVKEEFARVFQQIDLLAVPTTPIPAPRIGTETVTLGGVEYPIKGGIRAIVGKTVHIPNITGIPALTVPCGFTQGGLPVGLSLIGRPFEEALMYRVASRYEEVSPGARKLPAIVG